MSLIRANENRARAAGAGSADESVLDLKGELTDIVVSSG